MEREIKDYCIRFTLLVSRIMKSQGVPVLLYHRVIKEPLNSPVYAVSLPIFEKQMKYLSAEGYRTVSCLDLIRYVNGEITLPDKSFVITFDDGFQDNYDAIKIARQFGFNPVLFIATGFIGCEYDYLPFLGDCCKSNFSKRKAVKGKVSFLTGQQLRELKKMGVEIFPHTVNHRKLTAIGYEQQREEIEDSQKILHDLLGIDSRFFCYPYGEYNNDSISILSGLNYYGAFAVRDGLNQKGDTPFALKRHDVTGFSRSHFRLLLTEQFAWYHKMGKLYRSIKI